MPDWLYWTIFWAIVAFVIILTGYIAYWVKQCMAKSRITIMREERSEAIKRAQYFYGKLDQAAEAEAEAEADKPKPIPVTTNTGGAAASSSAACPTMGSAFPPPHPPAMPQPAGPSMVVTCGGQSALVTPMTGFTPMTGGEDAPLLRKMDLPICPSSEVAIPQEEVRKIVAPGRGALGWFYDPHKPVHFWSGECQTVVVDKEGNPTGLRTRKIIVKLAVNADKDTDIVGGSAGPMSTRLQGWVHIGGMALTDSAGLIDPMTTTVEFVRGRVGSQMADFGAQQQRLNAGDGCCAALCGWGKEPLQDLLLIRGGDAAAAEGACEWKLAVRAGTKTLVVENYAEAGLEAVEPGLLGSCAVPGCTGGATASLVPTVTELCFRGSTKSGDAESHLWAELYDEGLEKGPGGRRKKAPPPRPVVVPVAMPVAHPPALLAPGMMPQMAYPGYAPMPQPALTYAPQPVAYAPQPPQPNYVLYPPR